MKKILFLLLGLGALAACHRVDTYEERFIFSEKENGDTLGTRVEFVVELYGLLSRAENAGALNEIIRDSIFYGSHFGMSVGSLNLIGIVPESIRKADTRSAAKLYSLAFYLEEHLDEGWEGAYQYAKHFMKHDWEDYAPLCWGSYTEARFLDKYKNFQNYGITCDQYTGGAHGNSFYTPLVFDESKGVLLRWTDIIPAERAPALLRLIHEKAVRFYEDGETLPAGFKGDFIPDYFTLDEKGITWYTQPYEWSPQPECFSLLWEDLQNLLNPRFRSK